MAFNTTAVAITGGWKLFNEHCYSYQACSGPSMYPSINFRGEWLLVSKLHKHGKGVEVGDLVMFKNPLFRGRTATKRVLGMPGDFVLKNAPSVGDDATGDEDAEMIRKAISGSLAIICLGQGTRDFMGHSHWG
ncbi:conserved hypothetical protein [Histoplasma mississippiense (nom. inval.)]|uniref:conserved hypothetical protein n=1 Tax=Ajellomyces capsulatus (strain NAm1 / WU24) TaxID=2059318 RepID=UPI000157BD29|nr:conserved hypothetical protein [Histoplasma mississippiense (nom. inval.)]EDN05924.1 conserved hypothetical protein [Histoplasma mississippiense (nom. inval.)]